MFKDQKEIYKSLINLKILPTSVSEFTNPNLVLPWRHERRTCKVDVLLYCKSWIDVGKYDTADSILMWIQKNIAVFNNWKKCVLMFL